MKRLTALLTFACLAFAAGCGDNVDVDVRRDGEVLIIPQEGKAITALESAEAVGFADPLYFEDVGVITAFGSMDLADEAREMPGIEDVVPAGEGHPLDPELGIDHRWPNRGLGELSLDEAGSESGADR